MCKLRMASELCWLHVGDDDDAWHDNAQAAGCGLSSELAARYFTRPQNRGDRFRRIRSLLHHCLYSPD